MPRKDNGGLVSTYTKNNVKTDLLRVCIADKETKEYFETLSREEKSKLLKVIEGVVVESYKKRTGVSLEMFEVNDLCIDFNCLVSSYSFSIENLLPEEIWLVHGAVKGSVYSLMNELV